MLFNATWASESRWSLVLAVWPVFLTTDLQIPLP